MLTRSLLFRAFFLTSFKISSQTSLLSLHSHRLRIDPRPSSYTQPSPKVSHTDPGSTHFQPRKADRFTELPCKIGKSIYSHMYKYERIKSNCLENFQATHSCSCKMSYPSPNLTRPMSYSDGVRILVDKDVQDDINDACSKLAYAMSTMMDKFDSIAKQMHTLDLLRHTAPLKPRWESMRKVSTPRALWLHYYLLTCWNVASCLPGRGWTPLAISHERWSHLRTLKAWAFFLLHRTSICFFNWCEHYQVFCTAVLPMAARSIDGRTGGKSHYHRESLQVLQSYMTVSGIHHSWIIWNSSSTVFSLDFGWARCVDEISSWTHYAIEHVASWVLKRICQIRESASHNWPKGNVQSVT